MAGLFSSFRSLANPLGFGISDFVLVAFALLFTICLLSYAVLLPYARRLSSGRTLLTMVLLAGSSLLLRLALLHSSPVPIPSGADDFSYLLLADTLEHGRLANNAHPLSQFFEAVFVLQQPTYSSIFPLGQGLLLAAGHLAFGSYWAGVLLSVAALSGLSFWMLRGWISSNWALLGALLTVVQFGPLSRWTNSYWGGALSACGGCLVFGALPRLSRHIGKTESRAWRKYALVVGFGLGVQLLTRPFEFFLLLACVLLYVLFEIGRKGQARVLLLASAVLLPALALTLSQNRRVTGRWTTLPYMLSHYQYGVPTSFTFQAIPVQHRSLTPEQELDYRAQVAVHGFRSDSLSAYLSRLYFRMRYLRFFTSAPLYLAFLFYLPGLRQSRWRWPVFFIAILFAGTNFYPYFFPHYIATAASLFVLIAVRGLQNLSEIRSGTVGWGAPAARLLVCLCGAQFLFWYLLHFAGSELLLPATGYETWDFINHGDTEGRRAVASELSRSSGSQLVFVRYSPQHRFSEWIANAAEIDAAKIVWARDLGSAENSALIRYFGDRTTWLLQPDTRPPHLTRYDDGTQSK